MYVVSNAFKTACKQDYLTSLLGKITIINDAVDITESDNLKDFTIEDYIYNDCTGFIGSTIQKKLTANIININNEYDFENKEISVSAGITLSGTPEYVPFGNFIVEKPDNSEVDSTTKIIAYDYMIKFNIKYIDSNTYPITLKNFVLDLCSQAGVTLGSASFINEDFSITANPFSTDTNCITILSEICGKLVGGYAHIGRDNKLYINNINNELEYITAKTVEEINVIKVSNLNTTKINDLYTTGAVESESIDKNSYINFYKNSQYGYVNRLVYKSTIEGIVDVVVEDTESISTYGLTEITIENSSFITTQEEMDAVANILWTKLYNLEYLPFESNVYGFPYLDCGDKIIISDMADTKYKSFVFNHTFKFDGGFSGKIVTNAPTQTQTTYKNYSSMSNVLNKTKTNTLIEAKQAATDLINNFNGGYVVKQGGELFIADNIDLDEAVHLWRWNINGLGYSSTGLSGTYGLAMTMDGAIVADFITTGSLSADRISGGSLIVGGADNTNGIITVKNSSGNAVINLNKDGIQMADNTSIIGGNGVLSTFIFTIQWEIIGWGNVGGTESHCDVSLSIFIPSDITVTSATLYIDIASRYISNSIHGIPTGYYSPSNIKLYTITGIPNIYLNYPEDSESSIITSSEGTLDTSFTTWNPTPSETIQTRVHDVTNKVSSNERITFKLTGGAEPKGANGEYTDGGLCKLELIVLGYKK